MTCLTSDLGLVFSLGTLERWFSDTKMRLYDGIDGIDDMEMISTDAANNEFWGIQYIYTHNIIQYIYIYSACLSSNSRA